MDEISLKILQIKKSNYLKNLDELQDLERAGAPVKEIKNWLICEIKKIENKIDWNIEEILEESDLIAKISEKDYD